MSSDHVFICVLTDEEIEKIRRCQQYYPGDSFTNILTGLALEAAEKRIEDAKLVEAIADEYEEYEKSEKDCMWERDRVCGYIL